MLISIEDHALANDLCAHYQRSGFEAESVGGGVVEVTLRDAPTPDQERREVLMHLKIWEVTRRRFATCPEEA
jgi:hypothetical protein